MGDRATIYKLKTDANRIIELMALPVSKRVDQILSHPDPRKIISKFSPLDLFLTLKELEKDDLPMLLEYATDEQVNFIFDIEAWNKDRIDPLNARVWLESIIKSGNERFLRWLLRTDTEFLIPFLRRFLIVKKRPDDMELEEASDILPPFTLDDIYYIEFSPPDMKKSLELMLKYVADYDIGLYQRLMEELIWAIPAELEEIAYRFKKGRLEDQGLPDYYDAIEVFSPLLHEPDWEKGYRAKPLKPEDSLPTCYPVPLISKELYLAQSLETLPIKELEGIRFEMVCLLNKILVGELVRPDSPDMVNELTKKGLKLLNLGIDMVSRRQNRSFQDILTSIPLEYIFRWIVSRLISLQRRIKYLKEEGWLRYWPSGSDILDSPYDEPFVDTLEDINIKRYIADTESSSIPNSYNEFIQFEERIKTVELLGKLFFSLELDKIGKKLEQDTKIMPFIDEIKFSTLLMTSFANFLSSGEGKIKPFYTKEIPELVPLMLSNMDKFVSNTINTFWNEEEHSLVIPYIQLVAEKFREEFEPLKGKPYLSSRYIKTLLTISPSK